MEKVRTENEKLEDDISKMASNIPNYDEDY